MLFSLESRRLLVVAVQYATQDVEGVLHGAEAAVLVVSMVHAGMAVATHLHVKPSLLQVPHQRQAPCDGVRLALPQHMLSGRVQVLEGRRVQVTGDALQQHYMH